MYRTIVAGCDGGHRGRGAVSLAQAIASATHARLLLVGVHHQPPLPFPSSYVDQRKDLEHQLRAVRDELAPEAIVQVAADISPAHALRHIARFEHADLIVVGSRHRRRLQRILDSDHALQVLHGARCAVAVAPCRGTRRSSARPGRPRAWRGLKGLRRPWLNGTVSRRPPATHRP